MSEEINKYIYENNIKKALLQCSYEEKYNLEFLLSRILSPQDNTPIQTKRILLLCNWCDSKTLCETWNKMSKGNYTWNNIKIVWEEPCDYYVVINKPPDNVTISALKRVIYFQMEPDMKNNKEIWNTWSDPPKNLFMFYGIHDEEYNNNEWHLSLSYNELSTQEIQKSKDLEYKISTVLSSKYKDYGQILRIDFAKFLEPKLPLHVFGDNKFNWIHYKGSLPLHKKDDALLPYKYTINIENHSIKNYFTEKLIDGILAECLVFYWGCPNIREYIDSRAYIELDLYDFEKSFNIINNAINENLWEKRLKYIKQEKEKILNKLQFFPRIESILNNQRPN